MRALKVADAVRDVAAEVGATPAQVALAWTLLNPAVTSPVLGVRTLAQLEDNLGALSVALDAAHIARLDNASAPAPIFPGRFIDRPMLRQIMFGRSEISRHRGTRSRCAAHPDHAATGR